jgi:hypothetical protein
MSQEVFRTQNVALTGGWDAYSWPGGANLCILQCREDEAMDVSLQANGASYFQLKAGRTLDLSTFNEEESGPVTFYLRSTAGNTADIFIQKKP